MSTDIYVVSGFLGAGKTTLIQKFLREAFQQDKVVLIENDFGEISMDAAVLKSCGVQVKEINSGCICCSLQGDFVEAIAEIVERFQPEKIIIEPSGVGKLSDVVKACTNPRIPKAVRVKAKITVVDAACCKEYLENFGEFFEDQIVNAGVIILSRTETLSTTLIDAVWKLIHSLNPQACVFAKPWKQICSDAILSCEKEEQVPEGLRKQHAGSCHQHPACGQDSCSHDGSSHTGSFSCTHGAHAHAAAEIFDTVTIYTKKNFTREDLQARIEQTVQFAQGKILRAKGILHAVSGGFINLQYVPGDLQITDSTAEGGFICVIGNHLNEQELARLFAGD